MIDFGVEFVIAAPRGEVGTGGGGGERDAAGAADDADADEDDEDEDGEMGEDDDNDAATASANALLAFKDELMTRCLLCDLSKLCMAPFLYSIAHLRAATHSSRSCLLAANST